MDCNAKGGQNEVLRRFFAQLTNTHCRYLAESHKSDGVNRIYTYLDGEGFLRNWSFGENNAETKRTSHQKATSSETKVR